MEDAFQDGVELLVGFIALVIKYAFLIATAPLWAPFWLISLALD